MMRQALIILAEGFEEIEAITAIDVLRRADVSVRVAGLSGKTVKGAHGVTVEADLELDEYKGLPDVLILPGGMPGSANLGASGKVSEIIKRANAQKKIIAAICAAPALALAPTGILDGKKATCYPGCESKFPRAVTYTGDRVTADGNVITGSGPGSSLEFALEIVRWLVGGDKANDLKQGMLVNA